MKPFVTVLMAVRNGQPYIKLAIESILNQTYSDFILLIVDDESTDNTCQIVKSYLDPRIRLICLTKNVGQTAALNIGLSEITTPWIARMDADDFSAPTRLEEQIRAMENNPYVCCIGTSAWIFRNDPKIIDEFISKPEHDVDIKKGMLRQPTIIHGSILINRESIMDVGGYNEKYRVSADFDLYERLLSTSSSAMNIQKPLLGVRRHENQESRSLRAIEEGIEIFTIRLKNNKYNRNDLKVIRSELTLFYLFRVRYYLRNKVIKFDILLDILTALINSPLSFARNIALGLKNISN